MHFKSTLSFVIILLLSSCGNNSNNIPLELNNGEKWTIIESMIVYIRAMENDVASFENTPKKDYSALADKLKENIGLLTSNCTMEGKAHDELHKWLMPYIDQVKALSKPKDDETAEEVFKQLQSSFKTFNQHFK